MHQRVYYKECSIERLSAAEGLEYLVFMVETQSLAGTLYLNEVDGQVSTLYEAFEKFFQWSRYNSSHSVFFHERLDLRISIFWIEGVCWLEALERLYGKAVTHQDQLDEVHKNPRLLLEVLEIAVQKQSFYLYADRLSVQQSPQSFYQNCRMSMQKQVHHTQKVSSVFPSVTLSITVTSREHTQKFDHSFDLRNDLTHSIHESLFAKAGRRYGVNNRVDHNRRITLKTRTETWSCAETATLLGTSSVTAINSRRQLS